MSPSLLDKPSGIATEQAYPYAYDSTTESMAQEYLHELQQQPEQQHALQKQVSSPPSSSLKVHEKYSHMMNMTLDIVKDLTAVREGDSVWTAFGKGICIHLPQQQQTEPQQSEEQSMRVALSFGTLYHRQPEMIHKLLSENEYVEAMDHLDQVRKLQWTMQCEQWNVNVVGKHQECVACLFEKTRLEGSRFQRWYNINYQEQPTVLVSAKQQQHQ